MDSAKSVNVTDTYSIHVRTPNEDVYESVVDALKDVGVEIVAGETDPLVMGLFYLSRMNTKLDNLGQLRHLHKLVQVATAMKQSADLTAKLNGDILRERTTRQWAALKYYDGAKKTFGVDPEIDLDLVKYLSFEEIDYFFRDMHPVEIS
jgi:hypothetical protein